MLKRLTTMAAMQARHNARLHPAWASQGHAYYRAVWVECAELLDHYGWKWWKSQRPDLDQVKLEIVDIWHFGLSELLRKEASIEALAARMRAALGNPAPAPYFRAAVETLAQTSLATRDFDIEAFCDVMRALPLAFAELFDLYVGKNVLNGFRQQRGYRTGAYRKIWADGREDNEHLAEIAARLDAGAASFVADLEAALAARYAASESK